MERSNFLDNEGENVLSGFPTIPELRRTLQDQGRFDLCQSLILYEKCSDDYDASQMLSTYASFFQTFLEPATLRDANEPVRTKLALACLFYAEALAATDRTEESQKQIGVAQELLSKGSATLQQSMTHMPPTAQLWISKIHAKSPAPPTLADRRALSLKCANEAKNMQDWVFYREHMKDALVQSWELKETGDMRTRVEEVKEYFRILATYTEFEDRIIHSALYVSHAIWRYGVATHQQGGNLLEHYLDLVKTHERKFPNFSVPLTLAYRAHGTAFVAKKVGDEASSKYYLALERRWNDRCPWMVKRFGEYVLKDDLPDRLSHMRWSYDSEDPRRRKMTSIAARLIVTWAIREVHNSHLSKAELTQLLLWDRIREAVLEEDRSLSNELELDTSPSTTPDKLCGILFNRESPLESHIWDPWFSNLERWLKRDQPPSRLQRLTLLKEIQGLRCCIILDSASAIRPMPASAPCKVLRIKEEKRLLSLLQEIRASNPKVVGEYEVRHSRSQYAGAIANLAFTRGAEEQGFLTDNLILEAIDNYKVLIDEWAASDEAPKLLRSLNNLGTLTWIRWWKFKSVDVGLCLPIFRRAEEVYQRIRIQASVRSSSRVLMSKAALSRDLFMSSTYEKARCAALVAHNEHQSAYEEGSTITGTRTTQAMEVRRFDLISWCQGSKAQALTDVLGLEAEIPASMMASIQEFEGAVRSLAMEKAIIDEMNGASLGRKAQLHNQLNELQITMLRDEPSLRPILDMRSGNSPSPQSFMELAEKMGPDVVTVDWMEVFGLHVPIWMLIYRAGKLCNVVPLRCAPKKALILTQTQISNVANESDTKERGYANKIDPSRPVPNAIWTSHLQTWVNDNLTEHVPLCKAFKDDPNPSKVLNCKLLLGLVSPLLEHTKRGERLLFCPTQILHRLPLHALELAGTPVIERNPVIYIQNTSLLSFTLQLSEQAVLRKASVLHATIFNTLGDDPKAVQSVQRLNNILGKSATTTSHCTKASFAQLSAEADIVHTHGHIVFDPKDPMPLKHHLVLGHPEDDPENQLTADEICNIKFRRGALIMAMGCNSGRARESACDDLLGLTAAFHCAGAGSVVSTLWMIDADDCVTFACAFYEYLMAQLREADDGSDYVDLAVAMQQGVAAVRFDAEGMERDPYHWAGFVLHGSWRFARRKLL